ncbi:MAG: phosphoribosylformylglycinamidine synthase, partial [Rikenellaceae bacterium]
GGHLNCLSELVEATGGVINIDKLPIGDPTLSAKEIVGNESQERMGLVMKSDDIARLEAIAERERAPLYVVGETTNDMQFTFVDNKKGERPIDLKLEDMFGNSPKTVISDVTVTESFETPKCNGENVAKYVSDVLSLEAVACKDWLTNKVDRSVSGRISMQQCSGQVQLPLNDYGAIALDYQGEGGVATALGHAPSAAIVSAAQGSVLAITESLTNIVFAPITGGLKSVSLSANWMWPCKNKGEDARLYSAVESASEFAIGLGINIPTGKDSLSMTQKYADNEIVYSPGTVIITSVGPVSDVKKCVKASLVAKESQMVYVDFSNSLFSLGGSALYQTMSKVGSEVPTVDDAKYFAKSFEAVQSLLNDSKVLAGHDISAGGLITALLEMTFADNQTGLSLVLDSIGENDLVKLLFSEKPSVVLQVEDGEQVCAQLKQQGVNAYVIGDVNLNREFVVNHKGTSINLSIDDLRDVWYRPSYLLDAKQSGEKQAADRFANYAKQELVYKFPESFTGKLSQYGIDARRKVQSGVKAAIIREKGSNGEREMAWAMHLAGMDVKDVHMTDLISGRENLEDVNLIVFVGGFSNSDVLNSAKGWAGAFLYNEKAKRALDNFYARKDTLSLGVCNGCQLMIELGLINPTHDVKPRMLHNNSHKFESNFVGLTIAETPSIMLKSLEGSSLGVWVAHGEGKFDLPKPESEYNIAAKYLYAEYPANPNGSNYNAAALCSDDGRHLVMMPHPERCIRTWNWGYYPHERMSDEVTPWIELFVNAKNWIKEQ